MNLDDELDAVAEAICKKLKEDTATLDELIGGMKVLTTYYIARNKVKPEGENDDGDGTFEGFGASINKAAEHDRSPKPPASRRRISRTAGTA